MTEARNMIPWLLIGLWVVYVFAAVPNAPNPYPKTSRWWLSYQLFGAKRGKMMLGGIIVIGFFLGLLFVPGSTQ